MSKLLEAQDELNRARDLVHLIHMTTATGPDEDQKAISAGCEVIEERFEAAFRLLEEFKAEA